MRIRIGPAILLVMLLACVCSVLPIAYAMVFPPDTLLPPRQLPSLPGGAEHIRGVELGGFYEAMVFFQSGDGGVYGIIVGEGNEFWDVEDLDYHSEDKPCQRRIERDFEGEIGQIKECRQFQLIGEWCPGPIASYAIDSRGDIWEIIAPEPCWWDLGQSSLTIGFLVFGIGLIFVIGMWLVSRLKQS